jgi:ZIP family zinc transporter
MELVQRFGSRVARLPQRFIIAIMAFGAGVLTLSFELMDEALQRGRFDSTAIDFISGATVYTLDS